MLVEAHVPRTTYVRKCMYVHVHVCTCRYIGSTYALFLVHVRIHVRTYMYVGGEKGIGRSHAPSSTRLLQED